MEAAAALLPSGLHVAVGAHDGRASVLSLADGRALASASLGGLVRAPLATDPWRGGVWAASHAGRLACLRLRWEDPTSHAPPAPGGEGSASLEVAWDLDVGAAVSAGAGFGAAETRLVLAATLAGALFAVRDGGGGGGGGAEDAPAVLWRASLPAPAFAAPVFVPAASLGRGAAPGGEHLAGAAVLAAAADGTVSCFAAADGARLWRAQAGGSLFAPPALAFAGQRRPCALVAADDSTLHALDLVDGSLVCRQPLPVRGARGACPQCSRIRIAQCPPALFAALL